MHLILASSSSVRKELLHRLQVPFTCSHPDIDETPLPNEPHDIMVIRLSEEKAKKGAEGIENGVCIGSDTVASFENTLLGKPLTFEGAVAQLEQLSGKEVKFLTGVCVYATQTQKSLSAMVPTVVHFKKLTPQMIDRYLTIVEPFHCSGSFKSESLGVCLVDKIESEDPNAIMGLPLIKLCHLLNQVGYSVLEA